MFLRLPGYLAAFGAAGLELVDVRDVEPTERQRAQLEAIALAERWSGYSIDRLAALEAQVIAARPPRRAA